VIDMLEWIQLDRQSIPSGGGLKAFRDLDDIVDPILGLSIVQTGQNVTDEATLAEILAGFGSIDVKRGGSSIVSWDADDLYYWLAAHQRGLPIKLGGTADNHFRRMCLWLPFGWTFPWLRQFDTDHGLVRGERAISVDIDAGSDSASGMDNRTLDVAALIARGMSEPSHFLGHILHSYTAAANEWEEIRLGMGDEYLCEIFLFQTTNIDDGVTSETTTVEDIRITRNEREDIIRRIKAEMFLVDYIDGVVGDEYILAPLPEPLPLDVVTKVELYGGDAQAVRAYPGLYYLNRAGR